MKYVRALSPLKVSGVDVIFDDVSAADAGVINVKYTAPTDKSIDPAAVEAELKKNAGLVRLLGKGKVVASKKE